MVFQREMPRELKGLLRDLIDTADVMLSLLRAITRDGGLEQSMTLEVIETVMRYILAKVMQQEGVLERFLEDTEPEAYLEWLQSVAPESCVFQGRKEQAHLQNA